MAEHSTLGQPIGTALPDGWTPPQAPTRVTLRGNWVHVVPLNARTHGPQLFEAFQQDKTGAGWTYMTTGPYETLESFMAWLEQAETTQDPMFFAYLNAETKQAIGYGALLRINSKAATIEIGSIRMSPLLQRTPMSTEAMYLKAEYVFGLGYRRFEWKCDALNGPSNNAAKRLGFTFEGIHRKATQYKGRSRDTAWYSMLDEEWPVIRHAHKAWLHPDNFAKNGKQNHKLTDYMRLAWS